MPALDLGRQAAHLLQRREVGLEVGSAAELLAQRIELLAAAAVEEDARAAGGEVARDAAAEPVGRAGDQDGLSMGAWLAA